MRRGEVRLVDFESARSGEASKVRPAVIVSNDHANSVAARLGRGTVTVVAVTSNVTRIHAFNVSLPSAQTGLRIDSKAQADQVRSVAISRVGRAIGVIPAPLMAQLDDALRLHLQL